MLLRVSCRTLLVYYKEGNCENTFLYVDYISHMYIYAHIHIYAYDFGGKYKDKAKLT